MEIKVGHNRIRVILDEMEAENGKCGATYHQLSQIRISPYLSDSEYRGTLFHEVIHAVANYVGIQDDEHPSEEEWISRTSNMLLAVLEDNPHLVKKLLP